MRRSFHQGTVTTQRRRRTFSLALLIMLLAQMTPGIALAAPPIGGLSSEWTTAETEHFRFHVQSDDPDSATTVSGSYGPYLETGLSELVLLFPGGRPPVVINVYVYSDVSALQAAIQPTTHVEIDSIIVRSDSTSADLSLHLPQIQKLSAVEAENTLRHALSHIVTGIASGGNIPWGFDEGIAQYIERPVNERLARTAALVQTANESGKVLSWFDMNAQNPAVDATDIVAQSYATIAFLIDRYDLAPLRLFLSELKTAESWRTAMQVAYARDPNAIEDQFREDLRRWTTSKWRDNLTAGFDLEPAKRLLDQANYSAAKSVLEPSLALYGQLDAPAAFEQIKALVAQCDIGIQAESLMVQAQDALSQHSYERAQNLLAQARIQFDLLPENQRPIEILALYDQLALDGTTAGTQLKEAELLSVSWRDYIDARSSAVTAGTTFAAIGDTEQASNAQGILDDLDKRQRRIVMSLGALAFLTLIWLLLWVRARGPAELDWR